MTRGQLRIIAGHWRSRLLTIPDLPDLRPTPDRVRETLFNWLQPVLPGAHCLDLFAGTGVLGLESLSRGADSAGFLERDPSALAAIRQSVSELSAEGARVLDSNALTWLQNTQPETFDIVFLDPPWRQHLLEECLALLNERNWLATGAQVYLEAPASEPVPVLPEGWNLLKQKRAGDVAYFLARYESS